MALSGPGHSYDFSLCFLSELLISSNDVMLCYIMLGNMFGYMYVMPCYVK